MVPWNHLGARTLGGYLQTSLAKKRKPVRNGRHQPMGCGPDWIKGCIKRETESSTSTHSSLRPDWSASRLCCHVLPAWWTLYLLLNHEQKQITLLSYSYRIFFHSHQKRNQTAADKEKRQQKQIQSQKCCFYIHNNSPSVSVFKKILKQTHKDWEYRSAVEHSKISFVPTSSCQEIYTENTCFSVKSRHNYLSILSKSIQHKKGAGSKGMGG